MIFSRSKSEIEALRDEVRDLQRRVTELEGITRIYERLTPLKSLSWNYGGYPRPSIPINQAIYALQDYLSVTMKRTPPKAEGVEIVSASKPPHSENAP